MPSSPRAKAQRPAPLACLQCRRTHLKCDGGRPVCARCTTRDVDCDYTPSKRGLRRGSSKRAALENGHVHDRMSPSFPSTTSQWTPDPVSGLEQTVQTVQTLNLPSGSTPQSLPPLADIINESNAAWPDDDQLVTLYYLNFHASHPILVPRSHYWTRNYPHFLKATVEFIGSQFSPAASNDELRAAMMREIESAAQDSAEMVQARVLCTIALFARNEVTEGQRMLERAIDTALKLRMDRREFAAQYANTRPVEAESMRRTWYELYVTDACIAAFQRKLTFKTNTVGADVHLPCEDKQYDDGLCTRVTISREDFDRSVFMDLEQTFSSFCYRIEAVRLLGRVLTITGAHGVHRDQVQAMDNALAAFLHHLPPSKSEPEIVNTYGEVDELLFQAHMVIQYATMLLHFPRGDLASPVSSSTLVPGGSSTKFMCPCTRQHVHSIKAIDASKSLSMLAALRVPVQGHSPFLVYPLALGAVVQLSVSAIHSRSSRRCVEQHCDRVKLILGVLKSFGRFWSVAGVVLRALNKMALAVFQPSHIEQSSLSLQDYPLDSGIDPCSYATPTAGNQWLDNFNLQDIQGLIGLSTEEFCL